MDEKDIQQIEKQNHDLFLKNCRQQALQIAVAQKPLTEERAIGQEPSPPYHVLGEAEKIYLWLTGYESGNSKSILKEILGWWLVEFELVITRANKESLIKEQKFEGAKLASEKEKEIEKGRATYERIKELRDLIK